MVKIRQVKGMEVVLKLASRCNSACKYCYMFRFADQSFKNKPPITSREVVYQVAKFLSREAQKNRWKYLQIDFHGGEPLLVGYDFFEEICGILTSTIPETAGLSLGVQTNGILIDEKWLQLFQKFKVGVGISIDGPPDAHNQNRVYPNGKGTYSEAVYAVRKCVAAWKSGLLSSFGVLCVVNPRFSGKNVFEHLVDEVGITRMDFMLPDANYAYPHEFYSVSPQSYARFLMEAFNAWTERDDPNIRVRIFNCLIKLLLGGQATLYGFGLIPADTITIDTDGSLEPEDILRICGDGFTRIGFNVWENSISQLQAHRLLQATNCVYDGLCEQCKICPWVKVCGGGHIAYRYSKEKNFNNPNIFCYDLQLLYEYISVWILKQGYSSRKLYKNMVL